MKSDYKTSNTYICQQVAYKLYIYPNRSVCLIFGEFCRENICLFKGLLNIQNIMKKILKIKTKGRFSKNHQSIYSDLNPNA